MKLKSIHIKNYRQFIESGINFENEITVLAGANNSGKTSLVELFGKVFGENSVKFNEKDIPIIILKKWCEKLVQIFREEVLLNKDKLKVIYKFKNRINEKWLSKNSILEEINNDSIIINLEVSYEENENIENFSDYLMELDDECKSFFFQVKYCFDFDVFIKNLELKFFSLVKANENLNVETNIEEKKYKERVLFDLMKRIFFESFKEKYFYTDKEFKNNQVIKESKKFKKLFYYKHIIANREVDDESADKKKSISKSMISYISNDDKWNKLMDELPDEILRPLQESKIKGRIQEESLKGLNDVINKINSTNGGNKQDIVLDMDVNETSIKNFLNDITCAKYMIDEYYFDEASQGLGYNHMIFMHLQIEEYLKEYNKNIVNLFIIEEPEAHMHPQMQRVFIKHLFDYYSNKNIQGMITTHSSEIVKVSKMRNLRVIRPSKLKFQRYIYDINNFLELKINRKKEIESFYNFFFEINFSNIIFADKVIMYEGDTERMYLQSIIKLEKYEILSNQYIAFIQVGGAYAHWYKDVLEFLNIKTLILTDIDYNKDLVESNDIKTSETTNGAIKCFYTEYYKSNSLTITEKEVAATKLNDNNSFMKIEEIYVWQNNNYNINNNIMINFQGEKDYFTRTLEEAMLTKFFNMDLDKKLCNKKWKYYRNKFGLRFSIPKKKEDKEFFNIRDIVNATSDKKTDFMYSVIFENYVKDTIPNYIEEGLNWLMK